VIRFRGFTKRYGGQLAVEALDLAVGAGEVVALIGPNGSGKTTTLKAAAGLLEPSAGEVFLGDPPQPASLPAARRCLSFLPQKVSFPEALTGHEVASFYGALRGAPAERGLEVLRFARLDGAGDRAVGTYSGGMVQRLGLAVALLPNAPVFLLDEPTAALDPDGLHAFYAIVERARQDGRSVLFTSHQLGDAERLADRFAVLVAGRLAADLTASELKDRLSARGLMRVRVARLPAGLLERLQTIAPGTVLADEELLVPGPSTLRPGVLGALREAGGEIRSITAEEGRLDALYRELVETRGAA
jgi:Cu-processing system ATP-binding protein